MNLQAVGDPPPDSDDGAVAPTLAPPADVHETQGGIVMFLDIPGADPQSVNVQMQDHGRLSVVARSSLTPPPGYSLVHSEQSIGNYAWEFTVSDDIDEERIAAILKDGVLRLNLPKAAKASTKKIPVSFE